MSKREVRTTSPLWLELSGLPGLLSIKTKGLAGWMLFKKITELDCERNNAPGTVEISLGELERRTGISPDAARKIAVVLRKLKMLASFLPDNDEEAALFRIVTPLNTPTSAEEIRSANPHLFEQGLEHFRYVDDSVPVIENEISPDDADLKEVVDLYFDVIGLKMNAFILDELRMLPQRFSMTEIRNVFRRARKNEIRSLHWVMQELVRLRAKAGPPPEPAQTPLLAVKDNDTFNF